MTRTQSPDAGYTLTEMLVVIGIIGLIAAVLTPTLIGNLGRAKSKAAELQLKNLAAAVELFKDDVGRYPTDQEGLAVLVTTPAATPAWVGPYAADAAATQDPWGTPVQYRLQGDGRHFQLRTLGADGAEGGSGADRDLAYPVIKP